MNRSHTTTEGAESAARLNLVTAGATDVGCVRIENQDRFFISKDNRILVVADGMGGHHGGSKAASIVVAAIEDDTASTLPNYRSRRSVKKWVDRTLKAANSEVYLTSTAEWQFSGMGTTLVAIVLGDDFVHVAHAGDSRAYRLRQGKLFPLSKDHSIIQQLVDEGIVAEEKRRGHRRSHIVTRYVGEQYVELEHHATKHKQGDLFLLCSDGLTDVVLDQEIERILNETPDLETACQALVDYVKTRGAPDNVTVVLGRID